MIPEQAPLLHASFVGFDPAMMKRLHQYGTVETLADASIVSVRGDRDVDMFVVLEGALEIFENMRAGLEPGRVVARLQTGQFTGELDLLDNRRTLLACRTVGQSRLLRISRTSLKRIMRTEPEIATLIMQACIARRVDIVQHAAGGLVLIGLGQHMDTLRLKRFLTRIRHPYRMLDAEADPGAQSLLQCFHIEHRQLPVILLPNQRVLLNPSNAAMADELGITDVRDSAKVYDVAIVGAGPAGLAAAVYAASEGLSTIVIEGTAPGGQAGTSSHIENYLGFPTGVSGQELSEKFMLQAQRFGAEFAISRDVLRMSKHGDHHAMHLDGADPVRTRAVIIATGAKYQRLQVPQCARFEYQGVHYAATSVEAGLCRDQDVVVVGAGNSAGQAALFLSQKARRVFLLVRGEGLKKTMSDYLVQRIVSSQHITLCLHTEIVDLDGDDQLRTITWCNAVTRRCETRAITNVFVMIGASPRTTWLRRDLAVDDQGFIVTGSAAGSDAFFGTSQKGIFAVGDVRSGSVKRVASAVGEGSVVISEVHKYLAARNADAAGSSALLPMPTIAGLPQQACTQPSPLGLH